jgi:hypothetical protein
MIKFFGKRSAGVIALRVEIDGEGWTEVYPSKAAAMLRTDTLETIADQDSEPVAWTLRVDGVTVLESPSPLEAVTAGWNPFADEDAYNEAGQFQ